MTPNERLERATWDLAWVPPDTRVVSRPELLALAYDRDVAYLNIVLRTRAPAERLPALLAEVGALHGRQTSRWSVVDTVPTGALCAALEQAGYAATQAHDARLVHVDRFVARASSVGVRRVTDAATLRDCWAVSDAAFGPTERRDEDVARELAACAPADARTQRFVAYLDGAPVSSGGINLYPHLDIGLLWAGGTVPSARGRGAYSALLAARLKRAKERGVSFAGLYAREDTSNPIVTKLGFERHGSMTHFTKAGAPLAG
jgi:GNAT superfamily N-acetyltransferase